MGPNPAVDGHRLDQAEPIEPVVEGIAAFVRARLRWVNIDAVRKPKAIVVLKGLLAKHHAGSMCIGSGSSVAFAKRSIRA